MCKKKKRDNIRLEDVPVMSKKELETLKPLGKVFYLDFSKNSDKKFV